jgi:tetratricopeptide (TPR) repeat protein
MQQQHHQHQHQPYVISDKDKLLVSTPFGEGAVVRTRLADGIREIELTRSWVEEGRRKEDDDRSSLSFISKPTMLYSSMTFPSVPPTIGAEVVCLFGRGKVIEIRKTNQMNEILVVQLSSWRLSNRSLVTCYLQKHAVQTVRPKVLHEMNVYERVEYAQRLKTKAAKAFVNKQYREALRIYTQAVEAVRYVHHTSESSNNAIRADLLVVMITCSNNAATSSSKLGQWDVAQKHAASALVLIDALEPKRGGKIHYQLLAQGHSDVQVFGEWKVKSYILTANALAEKGFITEAIETVRKARRVIALYTNKEQQQSQSSIPSVTMTTVEMKQLLANEKELVRLLSTFKERKKAQLKKEKQRARAMFASKPNNQRTASPTTDTTTDTTANGTKEPTSPRSAATNNVTTPPSSPNNSSSSASCCQQSTTTTTNGNTDHDYNNHHEEEDDESGFYPVKKKVTFAENGHGSSARRKNRTNNNNQEVPWHKDPAFLGGLGVMIGTMGTILLLSHVFATRRNK